MAEAKGEKDAESWDVWEEGGGGSGGAGGEHSEVVAGRVSEFTSEYTYRPVEHCESIGADGKVLLHKAGTVDTIEFTKDDMAQMQGAKVFIHNHPSGSSFGPDDIITQRKMGVETMIAVGDKYKYSARMTRPVSQMVSDDYVRMAFKGEKANLMSTYNTPDIWGNPELQKKVWQEHSHAIWKRIGKECGIEYKREAL
jgi:hypothetical protein